MANALSAENLAKAVAEKKKLQSPTAPVAPIAPIAPVAPKTPVAPIAPTAPISSVYFYKPGSSTPSVEISSDDPNLTSEKTRLLSKGYSLNSTPSAYQPSLLEIYNARPDVQADFTKRFPGQNATTMGTEANNALNDWYVRYGKAEGADMAKRGILKPPTTGNSINEGDTRINTQTGKTETYTPEGIWTPATSGFTPGMTMYQGKSTRTVQDQADYNQAIKEGFSATPPAGGTGDSGTPPNPLETPQGGAPSSGDDIMTQFKTYTEAMAKNQADSQAKIETLMSKMGEDTTNSTLAKFQEMQTGLQDSFNTYFQEQSKYLEELKNQPSAVENLQKFREQQGLPQMEQMLAGVDKTILDTEGLLTNVEADIRKRTEGLPVSEAAARRLIAMEQKPLTKQMDELLRSRQRVAAGLEAKQNTVKDFMSAQTEDLTRQKELAEAKLGISKDAMGFKKDIATQSFDMFTTLQDSMNKINMMKIDQIGSNKDYKNKLAEAGFDLYTQLRAEKKAGQAEGVKFERELFKIQLETQLKKQYPDLKIDTVTDNEGNVSVISTDPATGESSINNLGPIGKAEKTGTDTNVVVDNERALMSQFRGEQIVKDYNIIATQKGTIDNIIKSGVGGPADLAMIFTFMKALDPSSVVRETEYDTAAKSGNIFQGWASKFNGYFKEQGGFLPDNVKREFQNLLNQKFGAQEVLYSNLAKQYTDIAERQGLNPQNVVVDYAAANPQNVDDIWGAGSEDAWNW